MAYESTSTMPDGAIATNAESGVAHSAPHASEGAGIGRDTNDQVHEGDEGSITRRSSKETFIRTVTSVLAHQGLRAHGPSGLLRGRGREDEANLGDRQTSCDADYNPVEGSFSKRGPSKDSA